MEHHYYTMERGCLNGCLYRVGLGIADYLFRGLLSQFFYLGFRVSALGIFQFDDIRMEHVMVDVEQRHHEDVGIAALGVTLTYRTIETVLACHGEGEAMYEVLALLLVALRGVAVDGIGDVLEILFPLAAVGKAPAQRTHLVVLEREVVFLVCIEKVAEYLFADHFIWDDEPCIALVGAG